MDWEQQGASFPPRFDRPGMQQYHLGGSRSRMAPFARSGSYGGGGGYKHQFYPPPPPPPPQRKYEVLMEAGRLAAEYLVAKGVLPPASLQLRGVEVSSVGWGQLPPPPPPPPLPPLQPGQEAPVFYNARNSGRRRFDDEYSNPNPRSRRSRGGDRSSSNTNNHDGKRKRKFGTSNRYSDWGRDRERRRANLDDRSYDDEDENAPPGYGRERRGSGVVDEVGSSVSEVAGDGPLSKAEAMLESELEDTGSKVSSNCNVKKAADALQEMDDETKLQEDSKVSNSDVVEQGLYGVDNSNNASSVVVEESETNHSSVPSDDKVLDEKPDDSSVLNKKVEDEEALDEKVEDDKAFDDKVPSVNNSLNDDCKNLLSYCSFARVPTKPRSIPAHRNVQREIAVPEQVDLVSSEEVHQVDNDEAENDSSLTNVHTENKHDPVCPERSDPSTDCNQMVELTRSQEKETQIETEDTRDHNDMGHHYANQETKEHSGLSHTLAHQNSLKLQIEEGIPIYNIDTPPPDEDLIGSADKGKAVCEELLPNIVAEASTAMEDEKLGQSSSFKIRDLNLVGSPEVADIRNDPGLGQRSSAGCLMEVQNQQQVDFGINAQLPLDNNTVQVINIEDDSPIEANACDTSKAKSEMIYSSTDNMMNPTVNTDVLPGIQDGYNLAISDFLGADMPCYQSIQTDLQPEMGLNDSQGITVMDDAIYSSLSDIGFMEVWDQPSQDYEKFF